MDVQVRARCITHRSWEILNKVYERALVFMHKMPVIWLDYLQVLMDQKFATRTRRAFDLALQSLPVTQHARVWALYTKFVKELGVWQTAVKVYRRYVTFDPAYREDYTAYLLSIGHFDEGARQIANMVNDDAFVSLKGTSKHAMWLQLCDIISKHPHKITRCGAVLCCAVLCCAVLCCAVLCCAVLCCAVLCCAVPFVARALLCHHHPPVVVVAASPWSR
jgi:pre-mRNA-splicing factor SYF1